MYFKKLELVGFKSFCDKTVLNFEPGITAVVGPNGCGKSNIFDSIRWVLGEQSAKSLRGSEMQDVIFNGTDSREPLSMAEVSLTFDNKNRFFGFDHDDLVITRRLFRSGESEYLLNKNTVRLKDVLDILLGTGVGAESYSIVAQGKIDLVLSSRPEDRRLVFDEASGITKYKSQKREALRKLEETEQNLLRVSDIINEVKRQIGSLERQANKARRYKEVFEELKDKEIKFSLKKKHELLKEKNEVIKDLEDLQNKEIEFMEALKEQESRIANRQTEIKSLEDKMMSARNEILNCENQIVRNNEHINFNKEKIEELSKNKVYLQAKQEELKEKLVLDEEKLNNLKEEFAVIESRVGEKTSLLEKSEGELDALDESIKTALERIVNAKKEILSLVAQIAQAKNEIADFNSNRQMYSARGKRLEIEKAKVYEEKAIIENSLNNIKKEVQEAKRAKDDLGAQLAALKDKMQSEKNSQEELSARILSLDKERLTLSSHKEFLEKLKTKYDDIGESLNATIYLEKMPTDNVSGLVVKIKDFVSLNDEDKSYFDPAAFRLSGEAKPIELDTERISAKITKIDSELEVLKAEKERRQEEISRLEEKTTLLNAEIRDKEIVLANKETALYSITEQFDKAKQEEDIIVLELSEIKRELDVLEQNIAIAQNNLLDLENKKKSSEDLIATEENNVSINSKKREGFLVSIAQIKTELEALNKNIASQETTLRILEDAYNHDQDVFNNTVRELAESEEKSIFLENEIKDFQARTVDLQNEMETYKNGFAEFEVQYKNVSEGAVEALSKLDADRKAVDQIRNSLHELKMRDKDIDYRFSSIKERMLQAYKADIELLIDVTVEDNEAVLISEEIDKLKQKLESYGTVNLVAIEEYDELKKRYDFLIQQESDLKSSKEALHEAIQKINRTTKQLFLETFEKVKEEFRNYFRLLFNGGDAQLFLIDEQDPLESGIEIICRPPGKKLQNVLLLSGGEKSLSAIALIFAIFKVKPSPFCILDEIDAALDEANVDRFARVLQEFAKSSQFIVITHNKKTIANADVMYGITMEQSGVSKIVSVKFAKGIPERDKEPEPASV